MNNKFLKVTAALAMLVTSALANASFITGTFTGGDIGEGLDFTGDFEYAVNARGAGGSVIGDASFTNDVGIITAQNQIESWGSANNYGNTANDNALEFLMQSIRWSNRGVTFNIALSGLTIGNSYSLQLLFGEKCCNRGFDIFADGQLIKDNFSANALQGSTNSVSVGAFARYGFTATASTLDISFGGVDQTKSDNNPILNAFTLENITSVSEPSTIAILALGMIGFGIRRFKK
mmetsp:Transcript_13441/g.42540  ORF Transcript_13441/g.42540 Transcript_13441/m.42540 type:complete len:234 (-) Transcript_13441:14-715(-)